MREWPSDQDSPSLPSILTEVPKQEQQLHQQFIYRHIDFLIDVLIAEQYVNHWKHPVGCSQSTPAILARKRGNTSNNQFPCRFQTLLTPTEQTTLCDCNDPLIDSDDPLDTVAAVAIASDDQSPAERYFDHEERQIIATLRETAGSWDDINQLDKHQLEKGLKKATNRDGISDSRVTRLFELVDAVSEWSTTDGTTLKNLRGLQYESICDSLTNLPGISRSDAWWLLLVAFDKPVWPADPFIDGLLCNLGLLTPAILEDDSNRRESLEETLADRQIPAFHRALAGHAVKGGIDVCSETCEIRKFLLSHRLRKQRNRDKDPVVIDLFAGAGGFSLGFAQDEWRIELAVDNDKDATDTYRLNHPEIPHRKVICKDIQEVIEGDVLLNLDCNPDVVVGGPPCQSLSKAGYRSRLADDDNYSILEDERTSLYEPFVTAIETLRPKAFVMENVKGMMTEINDSGVRVIDLVIAALESIGGEKAGYICDYQLLDAVEYGIPQHRERTIVVGIREDIANSASEITIEHIFDEITEEQIEDEITLQQGLSGVPKIRRGKGGNVVSQSVRGKRSNYVRKNELSEGTQLYFNHQAREHPMEKDQILFDEAMEPGDTGWEVKYQKDGDYSDLIEYDVGTEDNPQFKDKYRMLRWTEPAPTVVAHLAKDANNFVLPDYYQHAPNVTGSSDNQRNRGITPREAARLQSFPDDYIFLGSFTKWFKQIGNAIPPLLGEQIASVLNQYITQLSVSAQTQQVLPEKANADD